jgi:hypothetical protein
MSKRNDTVIRESVMLFLSDSRGQYIPRDFVQSIILNDWEGLTEWAVEACNAGPDHKSYWDAWTDILDNASYTDAEGSVYRLYQDGDLWLYCFDKMTDEEKQNLGFED